MDNRHQRLIGLDFIRAIAILLVVTSHFGHSSFDALGFFGVEMFFGLSGFLIGSILWRSFGTAEWSFLHIKNFWARRWWRTLPNYYLFLFLILLFARYTNDSIPPFFSLLPFFWFGQSLFSHSWGFYNVSWSLCIEEWFYFLFPILIFCYSKLGISKKTSFFSSLITILILSSVTKVISIYNNEQASLRYITIARLDAISYGVSVSFLLAVMSISVQTKQILFIVGLLIAASPLWFFLIHKEGFESLEQNPILLSLVPLGFSCMLPLASLLKINSSVMRNCIEKLSLYSYSIYLSHLSVLWVVYSSLSSIRDTTIGNLFSKVIAFVATIILSSLIYENFEVYLTRLRPKEIVPSKN